MNVLRSPFGNINVGLILLKTDKLYLYAKY
jgi:hypothetical protein